jgi:hypothetical protein
MTQKKRNRNDAELKAPVTSSIDIRGYQGYNGDAQAGPVGATTTTYYTNLELPRGSVIVSSEAETGMMREVQALQNFMKDVEVCELGADTDKVIKGLNALIDRAFETFVVGGRHLEGIHAFRAIYEKHLEAQNSLSSRIHKGTVLYWIGRCAQLVGYHSTALRSYLLALCEDIIQTKGEVNPLDVGTYPMLIVNYGWTPERFHETVIKVYQEVEAGPLPFYPEHFAVDMDSGLLQYDPLGPEYEFMAVSTPYLRYLQKQLGNKSDGKIMERIGKYLMWTIPGVRTFGRSPTHSTDHDVVAEVPREASRLYEYTGNMVICECKDTEDPTDFTQIAKLCRVIDSVKAKAGVVFTRQGVSGETGTKYGYREILKVYQDRGIMIAVFDDNDLEKLGQGANFYRMLIDKFRQIRLDLRD